MIPNNNEIREQLKNAPEDVRVFIAGVEFNETFIAIKNSHKLHFDEMEKLGNALVSVFVELRSMSDFPALLREALEQNSAAYDAVLKDVNEKIFAVFRASLEKKVAESEAPALNSQTPSPKPPTPAALLEKKVPQNAEKVTLSTPPPAPEKPPQYIKVDPYREPIE